MTESFKYQILDVIRVSNLETNPVLAFAIDKPGKGTEGSSTVIEIGGWVLGRTSPAMAVELIKNDAVFQTIPLNYSRPDVLKYYPKERSFINCGFQGEINMSGLLTNDELRVQAVFPEESSVAIAILKLWHNGKIPRTEAHLGLTTSWREGQLDSKLEEIKIDLERSRTFLERVRSELR